MRFHLVRTWAFVLVALTFMGCDSITNNPIAGTVACASNTVHLSVLDGFLIRTCGCNEAAGSTFTSGQVLNCTVPKGTSVFLDFSGVTVTHQIAITGGAATPVIGPKPQLPTQTFALPLPNTGTYPFYDVFFPSLGGNFIVQ